MRLTQIKLVGFKSFAEATTFQLPGRLVGVVGPNGCGKSNIIDAVRWVLGESRASELRGESMQDVIFNGSTHRKPAGRASVELVFDNAQARAGGQWNQFGEIAVKRVLTRDGTSSYHINNQPVRRRDVQDVFLGTGLGPRAYAIIGQGTISRIIESRPEDLRMFLEEAAGVSKYKERRRETENRLKDTRENLTRVTDILRELDGNLQRLDQQAEVALRYRGLQDAGTLKLHQLWFLKQRDAAREAQRVAQAIADAETGLEARTADLRRVEAELETLRVAHYASGDRLHAAQGLHAEAALAVSRLEERIRYGIETRQRIERQRAESGAQADQWQQRRQAALAEIDRIADQRAEADEAAALLEARAEEQADALAALQDALRAAQARSNAQRTMVGQVQQQIQLLAAERRSVDQQLRQFETRRGRLVDEQRQVVAVDPDRLEALAAQTEDAAAALAIAEEQLAELTERLPQLDHERREQQRTVNDEAARHAALSARGKALEALQDKVRTEGKLVPWLARQGLDSLAGLWTRLHIEAGWETALEAALRERLHALEVGRLDTVQAFASDAPPARLAFYHRIDAASAEPIHDLAQPIRLPAQPDSGPGPDAAHKLPTLASLLRPDDPGLMPLLADWLEGVYVADDLAQALSRRQRLAHGEVIMTRDGHGVSAHAVSFYAPDSQQAGMLARAQEIEQIAGQSQAQAAVAEAARARGVTLEAAYTEAGRQLARVRADATNAQTQSHQLQVELLRLTQQAQAAAASHGRIADELADIDAQVESLRESLAVGDARFEELDQQLADAQGLHADLDEAVIAAERGLSQARDQQRALERQSQESRFEERALLARSAELERSVATADEQINTHRGRVVALDAERAQLDDIAEQDELQAALAHRVEQEQQLAAARRDYDEVSAQLRRADEDRMACERALQPMRDAITALQLEAQAARLGGQQYLDQLQAAQVDLDALGAGIEQGGVRLQGLQAEIDRIQREIESLGAVNLAALDELAAARERKGFLDAQNADLDDAMATLESAIRKIDIETRDLLAKTFEEVNTHFGRMFPSLFGGGAARLVMTGDEILDAGVQVMAQPPGKRNSTIHLLSGGEKALTAIALVFAIFQLNPAPFCLLDEVDAPLDDANTERYAHLVRDMSNSTQFLFISHNKITMEMAEQLIGVTMQEQGVSRVVAVDMDAAVSLAEAA
jgi:chromosome segregation protein